MARRSMLERVRWPARTAAGAAVASALLTVALSACGAAPGSPVGPTTPTLAPAPVHAHSTSGGTTGHGGAGGAGGHVATPTAEALPGAWLGPFPGASSACNPVEHPESAEIFLYATGSFTMSFTPDPSTYCAGGTFYGHYEVQGDVIAFQEQGAADCASCAQNLAWQNTFSFPEPDALQLCDSPGACWVYYRQANA